MVKITIQEAGKALLAVIICQMAGVVGAIATSSSVSTWYVTLNKPWFTPPSWVFGPMWITIYTMIGIAAYLIWKQGITKPEVIYAMQIFAIQLLLNTVWSFVFFWLRWPLGGFLFIVLVLAVVIYNAYLFYKIYKPAGYLFSLYILWGTFATTVALFVWLLN
ncbi:TspO/MBR family protein [Candidatus Undinarchaeota archaeon]